jgi:hypothetical protein
LADARIDVKITVDASQAKDGFKQAQDAAKEMGDKVRAAGASAADGLRKPLEINQAQMKALLEAAKGDFAKAMKSLGDTGGDAEKALEKLARKSKSLIGEWKNAGKALADNLQTDARHLIAIFDEVQRGQRGATIASISALARDSGVLDATIKTVGAAAVWFATTPMGQVTAAIAASVTTIGIGITKLLDLQAELRRVGGEALAMRRAPEEAVKNYERLKGAITAQQGEYAEEIAQAIERIPSLSEAARAAIAKIAPAMLEAQFGGEIKQLEKHLPGIFGGSAEMTAFVERNRLLGGEQLATFLGASRATQAEMLAQALAARYGRYQAQLKQAAEVAGAAGVPSEFVGQTLGPGLTRGLAMPAVPAAPLPMPSQADIDAIEAIRKASPHRVLVEQLQQQIKTIQEGLAGLPESLQGQGRAAIAKLQAEIDKLKSLPGYQAGGIVPADQVARVHAGEMVLPAEISALLQSLARGGGGSAANVAAELRAAADRLARSSTDLSASAGRLDVSADAIDATMHGLEAGIDNALFGARPRAVGMTIADEALRAAMHSLTSSLLKDLQSGLTSLLFGPGTSSLGSGFSNLLFGPAGLGGMLFGSGGLSGLLGIGAGGLASAAFGSAISSAGIFPAIGSWISGLFSGGGGLAAFLGMEHGGIVPAAAQGWVVPHFQSGGILGVLHQREMVLPSHISDGLQSMIAAGAGGGGHTFNLHVSAIDGASVMRIGPQLVASINRAMRNGSMMYQPS